MDEWTVSKIYDYAGEPALLRWSTLGQMDSEVHVAYGREAKALIDKELPAMLVYVAIAKKAGVSAETIRKSYYTFHFFTDAVREQYCQVPYSIFEHARRCDDPIEVLDAYLDGQKGNGISVDEVKATHPADEDPPEPAYGTFPKYLTGAYRNMQGWTAAHRQRGTEILTEFEQIRKAEENDNRPTTEEPF